MTHAYGNDSQKKNPFQESPLFFLFLMSMLIMAYDAIHDDFQLTLKKKIVMKIETNFNGLMLIFYMVKNWC